jgi:enoyl-CoA hydratase
MSSSSVALEVADRVALVTLDAPDRRNALDLQMCADLSQVFDEIEATADVGAVVLTGRGSAFCAGADLSHLRAADEEGLRVIYAGFRRVAQCPLPVIAAVNGPAVGAGMNVALACDVRIVGASARFETRFLDIGIHPGGGHTWMLQEAVGPEVAFAMVVLGETVEGEGLVTSGLALRCVPDAELVDTASDLAVRAAAASRALVLRVKQTMRDVLAVTTFDAALERELVDQVWSVQQPAFQERLAVLQRRVQRA